MGRLEDETGFTLAETLVAFAILTVAVVGLLFSMGFGVTGADAARRSTAALFLAEQRMEQIKAFTASKASSQGWANMDTTNFPAEDYGSIPGYADYRRTVTVTDDPPGFTNTKQIEVVVFYRPVTTQGIGAETAVVLSTLLVMR